MRRMLPTVCLLALLLTACSDKSAIETKAKWLCAQDHLAQPQLDGFPDDHAPEKYVAATDLAALRADDEEAGAFKALAVGLKDVAVGARAAFADHTRCEVAVSLEEGGDRAAAEIKQTRPSWNMPDFETVGKLAKLGSSDEVRKAVNEMIDEAGAPEESREHTLAFVKEDGEWVALYDIEKQRKIAAIDRELEAVRKELAEISQTLEAAAKATAVSPSSRSPPPRSRRPWTASG